MTVSELIARLKEVPGNAEVWIQTHEIQMTEAAIFEYDPNLNFVHLLWSNDID